MRDRYEFLEKLRQSLAGRLDNESLAETMEYYREYFEIQTRSGKSEQELLEQLGDPRLLAKTILQTQRLGGADAEEETGGTETGRAGTVTLRFGRRQFTLPGWVARLLTAVVVVLVLLLCLFAFRLMLPFLILAVAARLVVRLLRGMSDGGA